MTGALEAAKRGAIMEGRAVAAFHRMYGRPAEPVRRSNPCKDVVRIVDPVSRGWAEWDVSGDRIRRVS